YSILAPRLQGSDHRQRVPFDHDQSGWDPLRIENVYAESEHPAAIWEYAGIRSTAKPTKDAARGTGGSAADAAAAKLPADISARSTTGVSDGREPAARFPGCRKCEYARHDFQRPATAGFRVPTTGAAAQPAARRLTDNC